MIVIDIETSGLDFNKHGVWQIGAIDLENPANTFLGESRIDDEDQISQESLKIIGKTEEELRDSSKQSQKELLENFFKWVQNINVKICICQIPQSDMSFLETKTKKYGLQWIFHHRTLDLHSIASLKHMQINNEFLIKNGYSDMGLFNILTFVGMRDDRGYHNALEDAKLTAECFSRIVYGKTLLEEYNKFPIPEYLQEGEDEDDYIQ